MSQLRAEYHWVQADGPSLLAKPPGSVEWWTFAGTRANAMLAGGLARSCGHLWRVRFDGLTVSAEGEADWSDIRQAIVQLASAGGDGLDPEVDEEALADVKFGECVPEELSRASLSARLRDPQAASAILAQPLRVVVET